MSLSIDIGKVFSVLLADGWHDVANDSFVLDSYEYLWREELVHGGGDSGVCATGFSFVESYEGMDIGIVAGPLTAIQAVRVERVKS